MHHELLYSRARDLRCAQALLLELKAESRYEPVRIFGEEATGETQTVTGLVRPFLRYTSYSRVAVFMHCVSRCHCTPASVVAV